MKDIDLSVAQLVSILGGWTVVIGGLAAWGGRLLSDRISSSWRREEQATLETIKHALTSDRLLLEGAIRGAQQGSDASHNLRLAAIQKLWAAVLSLRESYSGVIFFYDILFPHEYDSAYRKGGSFAAAIFDMNESKIMEAMKRVESVERERPYLGETLWLKFFIYRAFLGRLAHLIIQGKREGKFGDWRSDDLIRQILSNGTKTDIPQGLAQANAGTTGVRRAVGELEHSILEETSLILSGKRSAIESFENARDLFEAAAKLAPMISIQ